MRAEVARGLLEADAALRAEGYDYSHAVDDIEVVALMLRRGALSDGRTWSFAHDVLVTAEDVLGARAPASVRAALRRLEGAR